jgi:ribosomal protein S21
MKKRVEHFVFRSRILDNPEVRVLDGDLFKSIKNLKVRVGRLGTFGELKRRRMDPSVPARRRAKKLRAQRRLLEKNRKRGG